jgi:hypothetical protein
MKTHNLPKVEMGDSNSIHGLPASYKMGHLGKPINHTKMESQARWVRGKPNTKSMLTSSHGASGTSNGVYRPALVRTPLNF